MSNDLHEVGFRMPSGQVVYVPSAHSLSYVLCDNPECKSLHLFLLDQVGQPFAEATADISMLTTMRVILQGKGE